LRKFLANAYEIELPPNIGILPFFNVADLYPYREPRVKNEGEKKKFELVKWKRKLPKTKKLQMEKILDQNIVKRTRK